MKYISMMWKRIFDYKGKSSAAEFLVPFGSGFLLLAADFIFMILASEISVVLFALPVLIITGYLVVSFIPFLSLTARRLRDAGLSAAWCCLLFLFGAGAVIIAVMCAVSALSYSPSDNIPSTVYGPPPDDYFVTEDNFDAGVYGPPPDFDIPETTPFEPAENFDATVYGPPGMTDNDAEVTTVPDVGNITAAVTAAASVTGGVITEEEPQEEWHLPEFSPEINTEECVYGPPEWFDDDYDPRENTEPDVYGPPDWFE